ncbi:hypothetical protein SAMD00019534_066460 [Acytostelium subglobosum LB1]|uniref:hypothetical protein n=1 Tax=Acytostelium subglobosum LB1 TaxID=1410327 RepID=UPI0006451A80|nr:hypothetical protein SAMD00019534_066460 [Acytostelium subglobosum LB1]GAM23471.1 hypothetical protein SAMD00019534_066460 [Acytostelium subglobosum LB1]|eukprot:XP_012753920.1 hypothetical protein SAMD00019534_066460 [Acytostelium subglobosum LB1]
MRIRLRLKTLYAKPLNGPANHQLTVVDVNPQYEIQQLLNGMSHKSTEYRFFHANYLLEMDRTFDHYRIKENDIIETVSNPFIMCVFYKLHSMYIAQQENERRLKGSTFNSQMLIRTLTCIKSLFRDDIPFVGDDVDKIKPYLRNADIVTLRTELIDFKRFDQHHEDPIGHYVLRIYNMLPDEEQRRIRQTLDNAYMAFPATTTTIETLTETDTDTESEGECLTQPDPVQRDTIYMAPKDIDIDCDTDDDVLELSREGSFNLPQASNSVTTPNRQNGGLSFNLLLKNGTTKESNDPVFLKKLKYIEDVNMKLIQMFPRCGIPILPRVTMNYPDDQLFLDNSDAPLQLSDLEPPHSPPAFQSTQPSTYNSNNNNNNNSMNRSNGNSRNHSRNNSMNGGGTSSGTGRNLFGSNSSLNKTMSLNNSATISLGASSQGSLWDNSFNGSQGAGSLNGSQRSIGSPTLSLNNSTGSNSSATSGFGLKRSTGLSLSQNSTDSKFTTVTEVVSHFPGSLEYQQKQQQQPLAVVPKPDQASDSNSNDSSMQLSVYTGKSTVSMRAAANAKEKLYSPFFQSSMYATLIALSIHDGKIFTDMELAAVSQPFAYIDMIDAQPVPYYSYADNLTTMASKEKGHLLKCENKMFSQSPKGKEYGKHLLRFNIDYEQFVAKNNTRPILEQSKVTVVIDTREVKAKCIERNLRDMGVNTVIRKLKTGDYCFVPTLPTYSESLGSELMYPFLMERKTWHDLESSIFDSRYLSQKQRMVSHEILNRKGLFYLVEGVKEAYKGATQFDELERKIEEMVNTESFNVIKTNNLLETCRYLAMFAKLLSEHWDESRGMYRCAVINESAVLANPLASKKDQQPQTTPVDRSYVTMDCSLFKEYLLVPSYREHVELCVRQTRHIEKVFAIQGLADYTKSISSNMNAKVREFIRHHMLNEPLNKYFTQDNLLLIESVDQMLVYYYLLHLQVVVGVKVIPFPSKTQMDNLITFRDREVNLESSLKMSNLQHPHFYALPISMEESQLVLTRSQSLPLAITQSSSLSQPSLSQLSTSTSTTSTSSTSSTPQKRKLSSQSSQSSQSTQTSSQSFQSTQSLPPPIQLPSTTTITTTTTTSAQPQEPPTKKAKEEKKKEKKDKDKMDTTQPDGDVGYRTCNQPMHQEWWGTSPDLPTTDFYAHSKRCKKCYCKIQNENKRQRTMNLSANGGDEHLPPAAQVPSPLTTAKTEPLLQLTNAPDDATPAHVAPAPPPATPNNKTGGLQSTPNGTVVILDSPNGGPLPSTTSIMNRDAQLHPIHIE